MLSWESGEGPCLPGESWEWGSQEVSNSDFCPGNQNLFFFPFSFPLSCYSPFAVRQHFEKLLMFFFSLLAA